MELLYYLAAIVALTGFGYFLANDRIGSFWSMLGVVVSILAASLLVAYTNQHPDSVTHNYQTEFAYSVLRLTSFAFGFHLGYQRRWGRKHWGLIAAINGASIIVLVIYLVAVG